MKHTKRLLALLLCLCLAAAAVACNPTVTPEDTTSVPFGTTTEALTDAPTEPETIVIPDPEDYEVTVNGDTASVVSPLGLTYTMTGYTALDNAAATFRDSLTYTLDSEAFAARFNRFTLYYTASAPMKLYVTYVERGKTVEDMFYLDAGEGSFSGLNALFLTGYTARDLTALRVEPCRDEAATFTLAHLTTRDLDKPAGTIYVENERFKLGVETNWGGAVSYLEDKACTISGVGNLVNRHDTGRLIQQSFYGVQENDEYKPGVSFDVKWRYNPVQGGDQYNNPSRLIDLVVTENSIYIKAQPQDWSLDNALTPSYMENTYTLYDDRVQVDNRFTDYSGWEHPFAGQELPAFYTISYLDEFVWYNGEDPWTGDTLTSKDNLPFWGDDAGECTFILREKNTETWCAWINSIADYGLGVYAPAIDQLKAGRYNYDGSKSDEADSTGYVAPVNILRMVSFEAIEYSYLLTAGSTADIRETFTRYKDFTDNASIRKNYQSTRLPSIEGDISSLDFTTGKNISLLASLSDTTVIFDETEGALKLTAGSIGDVNVTIPYGSGNTPLSTDTYTKLIIEYMIPVDNAKPSYQSDIFICTGNIKAPDGNARIRVNLIKDGQYHVLEVDLANNPYWNGDINLIRFDYFDNSAAGDVMYVKSISLG